MLLVEDQRFKLSYKMDKEQINHSINTHMNRIKEKQVEGNKLMKLLQLIGQYVYKYGVFFKSNKNMAKEMKVSVRTIQRYITKLVDLHIILKVKTVRKNNSNTSNTIVILPVLKSLSNRICHEGCHDLNPSLKPLKQELPNNYSTPETNEKLQQKKKLMRYFEYKVDDLIEKEVTVKYFSSYVERIVKNIERQALIEAAKASMPKPTPMPKRYNFDINEIYYDFYNS